MIIYQGPITVLANDIKYEGTGTLSFSHSSIKADKKEDEREVSFYTVILNDS